MKPFTKISRFLDIGAVAATLLAVGSTFIWKSPSFNAELVVLLSALIASAYYGMLGALLICSIYALPVVALLVRTGAGANDWLIFITKLLVIAACSFAVARVTRQVWVRLRKNSAQLTLLRRELRRLRRVQAACEEITQQISENDIVKQTCSVALETLNAAGVGLWLVNNGALSPQLLTNWPAYITSESMLKRSEQHTGYFHTGDHNVVFSSFQAGTGQQGLLAAVFPGKPKRYRAALRCLTVLTGSTAAALSKARVLESHRKQADYLALLNDMGHKFTSNLGLEDLFSSMYREVRRVMDAEAFFVGLYDAEQQEVDLRYIFDDGKRVDSFKYRLNDGPTSRAIKTKTAISHHIDARLVPGVTVIGDETRVVQSMLVVPIILQDKVIGALSAQSYSSNAYTDDHLRILTIIAHQAAIAIDNAKLYEQTLDMALTDSMTGLANARSFHQALEETIQRASAKPTEISLIMIDSDCLKLINDRFGHLAGDEHIYHLSEVIRDNIRAGDVVARYAGDEFMVLLPNTPANEARIIAHRIVQAVRMRECRFGCNNVRITASAGVASYPRDASTAEELIRAADAAMYRAKHAGKDQVAGQN